VTQGEACLGFSCPDINPGSVSGSGDSCDCPPGPPGAPGAAGAPGGPGPVGPPGATLWLDVTDYGASTNPLVDSTAAFTAALAAAAANTQGTSWVLVPNVDVGAGEGFGIYSTVTIPANVVLFGVDGADGNASLIYSFLPSGDPVFQFAAGFNRSGIQGLQILGPSGAPSGIAISFTASQFNYAKNLQIWYHEIGIDFSDGVTPFSAYNLVEQCEVNNSTEVGIRALQSANANAIIGGRVFFTRNVGNTAIALQIADARALSISGGLALEDYNVGMQIGGAPSFSMTGCWLEKGATIPLGADFEILSTFEESALFEGGILFDGNHHADPWPLADTNWNARQWGALPANADNSAALQAVIDYASDPLNGGVVYIPAGSYQFATALTNPACVPIVCTGELVFTGSGAHALTYGQVASNTDAPSTLQSVLNIRRNTQDWTDAFAGLRLLNVDELQAIVSVEDFECGLLLQGDGTGTSYNQIQAQRFFGNRVGVRFHAVGIGWSNENTIQGGRYSSLQATSSALNMAGIEFVCDSTFSCNGNKILGPSFELHNVGAGFTSAIHGEFTVGSVSGRSNVIENTRIESTDYWISGEGVRDNVIGINYLGPNEGIPADLLNANTPADLLVLIQNIFDTNLVLAGSSDPIRYATFNKNNCIAVGANLWRPARGVGWNRATFSFLNAVTGAISDDRVTISSGDPIGFALDFRNVTRDYTRILTLKAIVRATGGRFAVVCWDAAGVRLTSADDCSLGFNGAVNYYRSGGDMTPDSAETLVSFGESVAFVFVGIATGTLAAQIEQFDVFGLGLADIRPLVGVADLNFLSAVPPNIGVYDGGDPISNVIPTLPAALPVPQAATLYPAGMVVRNILATTGTVGSWVYDGTAFVVTPTTVVLGSSTVSGSLSIDKPDAGTADINLLNIGVLRWRLRENTSENFLVESFDSAGVAIGTPFQITNSSGLAQFGNSVLMAANLTFSASAAVIAIGDSAVAGNARLSFRKGSGNNMQFAEWMVGTTASDSRWGEQFNSSTDRVGFVFDASGNLLTVRPYTWRYNVNNGRAGLALNRLWCDLGTSLVNGDVATNNMGAGATATVAANGKDMRGEITVTVGTAPAANPTVTLTFTNGTWTTAPGATVIFVGGTGYVAGTVTRLTRTVSATQIVVTFVGTPLVGETYIIYFSLMG
jgi:hypothetical protein